MKHLLWLLFTSSLFAEKPPRVALENFCISCHDADAKKGDVNLEAILGDDIAKHTEI